MTPELRAALEDKTIRVLHVVEIVLVLFILLLMVFKPF